MDPPALLARDLQDEDVVDVVVRGEALRLGGCDVGVDLNRVAEIGGQGAREVDERRPQPMQSLEHDRVPVEEQREHPVVGDLVADHRAGAPGAGVPGSPDDVAVLGHAG